MNGLPATARPWSSAIYEWAARDGETLVIVTADHETGGLTLVGGDLKEGKIVGKFSTGDHSGVMVPVYAFGPGAEEFTGVFENTALDADDADAADL